MRIRGMVRIALAIAVDFALLYGLFGMEVAALGTGGILLYAWLGEYIGLIKDGAIKKKNLNMHDSSKLERTMETLAAYVQRTSATDIRGIKLHVIPSERFNAFAYGFNNIAVTRGALHACDDLTLAAVLGHEVSHVLCLDAVFHRIVFANITMVIAGLIILSFVTTSIMWIAFLCLCLIGVCGGIVSVLFFSGLSKLVKGSFEFIQRIVLIIYQIAMGLISRGCEFRADQYAVSLGLGNQLNYFLSRFVANEESRQKTLSEILYDAHPATYKRILRIEQGTGTTQ